MDVASETRLQSKERTVESTVLTGCEMEIQELMKQIDGTISAQKIEWQNKLQAANNKLSLKEQEFLIQKTTIEQKNAEIARLQKNIETLERTQHKLTSYYHSQLMTFKDEITTMKNEHGKLLKKCGLPIKTDSVNSNEEVTRWLTTVESCNSKISDLEKEKSFLEKQLEMFEDESETLQSRKSSGRRDDFRKSETHKKVKIQSEVSNSNDNSLPAVELSSSSSLEVRKLKLQINQLQTLIRQKDQHISLLESNHNDNALIGFLEHDLYSAKLEMKTRIEKEESLQEKIKHLQGCLSQSNDECKKLVEEIVTMKQNDDSIKTKKELADKDALILKLENDLNKVEEIKSTLQQNEANTKIELQVALAHLNALKKENANLRRIYISEISPNTSDSTKYFQELQQAYYDSLRTLESQNQQLELTISTLQGGQKNNTREGNTSSFQLTDTSLNHTGISNTTRSSSSRSVAKKTFLEDALDGGSVESRPRFRHGPDHPRRLLNDNKNNNSIANTTSTNYNTTNKLSSCAQDQEECQIDDDDDLYEASISTISSVSGSSRKDGSI